VGNGVNRRLGQLPCTTANPNRPSAQLGPSQPPAPLRPGAVSRENPTSATAREQSRNFRQGSTHAHSLATMLPGSAQPAAGRGQQHLAFLIATNLGETPSYRRRHIHSGVHRPCSRARVTTHRSPVRPTPAWHSCRPSLTPAGLDSEVRASGRITLLPATRQKNREPVPDG
jgi:hypothetical protein